MMNKQRAVFLIGVGVVIASSTMTASAASRAEECASYASTATDQYRLSKHAQCNHNGSRWSGDLAGQTAWCMGVRKNITDAETAARSQLLIACYANKADAVNNRFPINLPGACRYNPEQYKAVRYIFTRTGYNTPPTNVMPIPRGLITYDFNEDRKNDYVFVERNSVLKFRTIMCMSSPSGWKRQQLWSITADVSNDFTANLTDYSFNNGKLSYSTGYHEHNLGSYSNTWTYAYSVKEKAFLLETFVARSDSGDGMTPNTIEVSDYVKGEIRETVDCSAVHTYGMPCDAKNNVIRKMKPADYTVAKRRL
jgi:hypothetical protein